MSISPSNQYNMTTTQEQFRIYQNQMQQRLEKLQKQANNIQYLYSTSSGSNGADLSSLNERVGMGSTLNGYQGQNNLTDIVNALATAVPPDITSFTQRIGMTSSLNSYNGQNNLTDITNSIVQQLGSYTVPLTGSVLQSTVTWSYNNIVAAIVDAQNKLHILASDDLFNQYSQLNKSSYIENLQYGIEDLNQSIINQHTPLGDFAATHFSQSNTLAKLIGDRTNWNYTNTSIIQKITSMDGQITSMNGQITTLNQTNQYVGNLSDQGFTTANTLALSLGNLVSNGYNSTSSLSSVLGNLLNQGYTSSNTLATLLGNLTGIGFSSQKSLANFIGDRNQWTSSDSLITVVNNLVQNSSTITIEGLGDLTTQNFTTSNTLATFIGDRNDYTNVTYPTIISALNAILTDKSNGYGSSQQQSIEGLGSLTDQGYSDSNTLANNIGLLQYSSPNTLSNTLGNLVSGGYNNQTPLVNVLGNLTTQGYTNSNNLAQAIGNLVSAGYGATQSLAAILGSLRSCGLTETITLQSILGNVTTKGYDNTHSITSLLGNLSAQNFADNKSLADLIGDRNDWTQSTTLIKAVENLIQNGSSQQPTTIEGLGTPTNQGYSNTSTLVDIIGNLTTNNFTSTNTLANVLGNLISNGYTADNNLASFLGNRTSINTSFTSTVAQTINQFNLDRQNQFMINTNLTENDSGWIQSGPIINNKFELDVITSKNIMTFNDVVYNSYFYITFQDNVQLEINATSGTINIVNCIFYLNVDETITETEILHAIGEMKFINCTFLTVPDYAPSKSIWLEVGDQNIVNTYAFTGLMSGEHTVQTTNLAAQVAEIQNTLGVIQ